MGSAARHAVPTRTNSWRSRDQPRSVEHGLDAQHHGQGQQRAIPRRSTFERCRCTADPDGRHSERPSSHDPHERCGVTSAPEDVAQPVRRCEPCDPGHAHERCDPAQRFEWLAEGDGRHDRHLDHLALRVHGSDREVAQVERPQQRQRPDDLHRTGPDDDRPESPWDRRQSVADDHERHDRHDHRQWEAVRVSNEASAVDRQHRPQPMLPRGPQHLERRRRERDGNPHGEHAVLHQGSDPRCNHSQCYIAGLTPDVLVSRGRGWGGTRCHR